jgi:hypothetical protein
MVKLWERTFRISDLYASEISFPFDMYEFDPKVCLRRTGKDCTTRVAVESDNPMSEGCADETIADIASIYYGRPGRA